MANDNGCGIFLVHIHIGWNSTLTGIRGLTKHNAFFIERRRVLKEVEFPLHERNPDGSVHCQLSAKDGTLITTKGARN